jgi:hypothetical protein
MHSSLAKRQRQCVCFNVIFLIVFSLVFLFSLLLNVQAATKFSFYYFNPDSVQSNFSLLTKGFGSFLKEEGFDASFQAFAQKGDFDRKVREERPALLLVPSWYYQEYGENLGLQPLLISLENGKPNYTKILLIRKAAAFTVQQLKGRTVAMTTMGPNTEELLSNNFFKNQGVDFSTMNIIVTPKDADALYALALGQVDAALVGQSTLNMVCSVNQCILKEVREIASSAPIPMPLLCTIHGTLDKDNLAHLKQKFQEGGNGAPLPSYMKMLNINGWQDAL